MSGADYPPVAFAFAVQIAGETGGDTYGFSEVSGLEAERDVIEYREGGENRFVHRLPRPLKHGNLVLKRGLLSAASPLMAWCRATLEGGLASPIQVKALTISLVNESASPVMTWSVSNAYPVKWSIGQLHGRDEEVAVETLEFAYTSMERKPHRG